MKITILAAGKVQEKYLREGIDEFLKRLKHYAPVAVIEVHGPKGITDPVRLKEEESAALLAKVPDGARIILLDDKGEQRTSEEFAGMIGEMQLHSVKNLVFIIGGSYGFSAECYKAAHGKLSLGRFTLPHQLVRLVFLEQVYRAFTILKGEKYHHG